MCQQGLLNKSTCPITLRGLAQSRTHKLSEDQHKLAAEMTPWFRLLCIRVSGWQSFGREQRTRFTA